MVRLKADPTGTLRMVRLKRTLQPRVLPAAHDARAFVSRIANLHEVSVTRIVRPRIRQDQLDETDDDGQMVAEGVHSLRAKA